MKKIIKFIFFIVLLMTFSSCVKDSNIKDNSNKETTVKEISNKIKYGKEYLSKDDVALYLNLYKELPKNYLTKNEAKKIGWVASKGNLWEVKKGAAIGGDNFSNREGKLDKSKKYKEADVNYNGGNRGAERLVYTDEGQVIYYTKDHYENFEVLYE